MAYLIQLKNNTIQKVNMDYSNFICISKRKVIMDDDTLSRLIEASYIKFRWKAFYVFLIYKSSET